ncbi:S66 peptidase family protein [Roseivirga sp.]|uniref:S66 peptidase family protein n=1 Tax=Roseivirga sp. TaxID=1964215 RepID=UPI003B8BAFEE
MQRPEFLKLGDKIAVVATAKRLERSIADGIETLTEWGLDVIVDENVNKQSGYFAGSDDDRLESLQSALDNPEIKAIIFARGGYGTTRIIDQVDFDGFKKSPKWLVGFSDLTSILLQALKFDVPSIHGPVAMTIGNDYASDQYLKSILFEGSNSVYPLTESSSTTFGTCSGKITGGNLTLICESIGTNNEIDTEGNILFIEEVGEAKYSLDRMLNKLKRAGKITNLSGVIIGSFSNISDPQGYFETETDEILNSYFGHLNIPIAYGLSAGHEPMNLPLIFGCDAEVLVELGQLTIKYLD